MKPLSKKFVYEAEEETSAPTEKPTEKPTDAPTEEPDVILYSQDFETFSDSDKAGWTSPAGTMSVKTDSTPGINKYQTVVSGKSGTCRSGYIEIPAVTDNFVFECDYKASSNVNVNDLELLESKSSVYANHGVYSNANFAFTMVRPRSSDVYVINNKYDDSGASLTSYTDPVFTTGEIKNEPWMHVKVVGNFDTQIVLVYITSLDGATVYYEGVHDMNTGRDKKINSWKCIHLLSPSTGSDTCIDNIRIRKAKTSDLAPSYHKVTMSCKSYSFDQYVLDGKSVVNIPDVSTYGDYFEGWSLGGKLYSESELKSQPITGDCAIEGIINENYIEALETVEFNSFPAGNMLTMGEDENTYGDNEISLKLTGEQGTSFVTSPDSRVSDFKIDWNFDGFRTLDGNPTGETGSVYCDSYAVCEINDAAQSTINFKLKKTAANYYGLVTAKVTYNGKEITVSKPLLLLADTSRDNNAIYPAAGYTADYGKYESTLDGYRITANDILTGGWNTAGSDSTYGYLSSDSGGRYLSFSRAASGNSSYAYQTIGNITSQTVFEQDIRFNLNGSIAYGNGKSGSVTTGYVSAFELAFDGSNLKFNGSTLCAAAKGTWYHIEINADPTSKKCFANVYELKKDGNYSSAVPLATSDIIDFASNYSLGLTYRIALSKTANKTIDINNLKIYTAEADTASFNAVYPQTAEIPETETATAELSISAETVSGEPYIGIAEWKIDDSLAEGVAINSTGNSTAQLIINSNASSGELPIRITLGGKSIVINIKLLGTKDNIVFTSAPKGIRISAGEHSFTAEVRNGNAETVSGKNVTYELFDENGTTPVSPNGLTLNSESGVLTVTDEATPQTLCVKAVSTDSDSNEISKLFKFTLYNLKFSFGTSEPNDGFTTVNSETVYSDSLGFGLEGNVTDEENAVSGAGTVFKLKLEKGRVYNVTAVFNGTIRCERINSSFPGFDKTRTTLGESEYKVAVFGDDIMDITLPSDGKLSSLSVEPVEYHRTDKPDWWTIGDSTVQQNGSWGYTIASGSTSDLSRYPELSAVIDTFHNSGKAGEQHKNFYTNGRLNSILTQMRPGDIVSLSGMGTNDSSSSQADFKQYDEIYMNAITDMGGYVILGSYTPAGNYGATAGKVYDSDTMTFKGMRTNAYDLAIRALYDENKSNKKVLGFLDIGKMADEKMTQDVQAVYTAAIENGADETAARSAANARAEEMMAWWKDYNHYYTAFSNYILPDITKAVAEVIAEKK